MQANLLLTALRANGQPAKMLLTWRQRDASGFAGYHGDAETGYLGSTASMAV